MVEAGVGQSTMALIFEGLGVTPSAETMWPKQTFGFTKMKRALRKNRKDLLEVNQVLMEGRTVNEDVVKENDDEFA